MQSPVVQAQSQSRKSSARLTATVFCNMIRLSVHEPALTIITLCTVEPCMVGGCLRVHEQDYIHIYTALKVSCD